MSAVHLREVMPRDGLQDHDVVVPAGAKVRIIERLARAGLRWIEVTSLVKASRVPQFADAEDVIAAACAIDAMVVSAFVPNARGLDRALAAGVSEVSLAVAATDALSQENFAMDRARALREILHVIDRAAAAGVRATVTVGAAFGCPYEGAVAPEAVLDLARALADSPVNALLVADTIGCAAPGDVPALTERVRDTVRDLPIGVHLHGEGAVREVAAAAAAGATIVDASTGGLGGCPFVPAAPGNVAMTAAVAALHGAGFDTGLSLGELEAATHDVETILAEVAADAGKPA